jgi:hypothetical protein
VLDDAGGRGLLGLDHTVQQRLHLARQHDVLDAHRAHLDTEAARLRGDSLVKGATDHLASLQ